MRFEAMPMTWIRSHYDRVALPIAALFLLCSALLLGRDAAHFDERFLILPAPPPPKQAVPPLKAVELEEAMEAFHRPGQWTSNGRSGLFVPEKHFIGGNGLPATLETAEVHPPVPNDWLEQFDLPIAEADVLTQDPDRDGFSNLEEWQNQTSPIDKSSHPAFIAKLKMKSFAREPFHLVFASRVGNTFALNGNDRKEPTQFLKLGELVRGTKFALVKFIEKYDRNQYGTKVDVSELILENRDTGEQLTLVKERITISPEAVANLVYLWGGRREFAVRKNQEFSLKPEERIKYRLVDVRPSEAVIVDTQNPNEAIKIDLLTP